MGESYIGMLGEELVEDDERLDKMEDNLDVHKNSKGHTKGKKSIDNNSFETLIKPKKHGYLSPENTIKTKR
jgi:hypothetical protein